MDDNTVLAIRYIAAGAIALILVLTGNLNIYEAMAFAGGFLLPGRDLIKRGRENDDKTD